MAPGGRWLLPRDLTRWCLPWHIPQPLAPSLASAETCFCWHSRKGPICQENTPINPDHETKKISHAEKWNHVQSRTAEAGTCAVSPAGGAAWGDAFNKKVSWGT